MKIRIFSIIALLVGVMMIANVYACTCQPYGLTPGYWKHWTDRWPISTTTTFGDIGINADDTLFNALNYQGYGDPERILLRQVAAAYLNSRSNFGTGLYYPLSPEAVVNLANFALQNPADLQDIKNYLEGFNQLGG